MASVVAAVRAVGLEEAMAAVRVEVGWAVAGPEVEETAAGKAGAVLEVVMGEAVRVEGVTAVVVTGVVHGTRHRRRRRKAHCSRT